MHLFAGVGGGLLADRILGHEPVIAVEWDGYACQVLRKRAAEGWFPNLRVWEGDVRLFDPSEYAGKVDCIHAGFPCQDISVAGKQAGVGVETRSGLYREVLRIAGVVRPRYLFLENVAAIVTNGLETVASDLAALGYDAEWLCLRASDCGAKHHRDRWWCLADSKSERGNVIDDNTGELMERNQVSKSGDDSWQKDVAKSVRIESFFSVEPGLGRVANGVPHRVHRLKGLGNAQVPLQAAVAWKLLGGE
jgi:DNA (cytosine-5)-methyltransferase 1